jgi:hypothetical protein
MELKVGGRGGWEVASEKAAASRRTPKKSRLEAGATKGEGGGLRPMGVSGWWTGCGGGTPAKKERRAAPPVLRFLCITRTQRSRAGLKYVAPPALYGLEVASDG